MEELELIFSPNTFFVALSLEDAMNDPVCFEISINDIQPLDSYLIKEEVEYYENNFEKIFKLDDIKKVIIKKCDSPRFKYYTVIGDVILFVLFKRGITKLFFSPDFNFHWQLISDIPGIDTELDLAEENYDEGIRNVIDFAEKIVSQREYDRLMSEKYFGESE